VRESKGEILAFTDDDCVAPSDWISSIVDTFQRDFEADLLYGQVRRAPPLVGHDGECPELLFSEPARFGPRNGFRIYGMGANFAARRRIFDIVQGFDEALGGGGPLKSSQDYDFQYRVFLAGANVLLCPTVIVDHYGLRTWDQWPATLRAYGFGDGAFYFKHVRCGDGFALTLLVKQLGRMAAREALSRLRLRQRPSRAEYVTSCVAGILKSLKYPVDRRTRLYRAA
jgi:GT2 family glycosyltransferase